MRTLRGKLSFIISIGVSLAIIGSLIIIDMSIKKILNSDIKKDMLLINEYAERKINESVKFSNEKLKVDALIDIERAFKCFVEFKEEDNNYNFGQKFDEDKIEEYREKIAAGKELENAIFKVDIKQDVIGTSYYPIYVYNEYKGSIIIQKGYNDKYLAYKKITNHIFIIEVILMSVVILIVYLIVKKNTKPLEILTNKVKDFGEGKKIIKDKISRKDEIGVLTEEFYKMEENILGLQKESMDFFDRATHELKTPLTGIKGYADLLLDEAIEDEFIIESLERISEESEKMKKLIENLLTLSKRENRVNVYKEDIEVLKTIDNILKSLDIKIREKDLKIKKEIESVEFKAYKTDFEVAINNLISNSVKYATTDIIEIKGYKKGEYYLVEIKNDILYKKVFNKDVFSPFIKGDPKQDEISSSGLGLYIIKKICIKNDWKISYEIKEQNIKFIIEIKI